MKINVKLLRRIKQIILRRYKQVYMGNWMRLEPGAGRCGTAACIAGWAYTLSIPSAKLMPRKAGKKLNPKFGEPHEFYQSGTPLGHDSETLLELKAAKSLGLKSEQRRRLFYAHNWPESFKGRLDDGFFGTKKYAKVVADRIEHFIATNGE